MVAGDTFHEAGVFLLLRQSSDEEDAAVQVQVVPELRSHQQWRLGIALSQSLQVLISVHPGHCELWAWLQRSE